MILALASVAVLILVPTSAVVVSLTSPRWLVAVCMVIWTIPLTVDLANALYCGLDPSATARECADSNGVSELAWRWRAGEKGE